MQISHFHIHLSAYLPSLGGTQGQWSALNMDICYLNLHQQYMFLAAKLTIIILYHINMGRVPPSVKMVRRLQFLYQL